MKDTVHPNVLARESDDEVNFLSVYFVYIPAKERVITTWVSYFTYMATSEGGPHEAVIFQ